MKTPASDTVSLHAVPTVTEDEDVKRKKQETTKSQIVVGVLPGIGNYDSDSSSNSENDSDDEAENSIINNNSLNDVLFNKGSSASKSAAGKLANK